MSVPIRASGCARSTRSISPPAYPLAPATATVNVMCMNIHRHARRYERVRGKMQRCRRVPPACARSRPPPRADPTSSSSSTSPTRSPAADEVLVRVAAAGVNFIDTYRRVRRLPDAVPARRGLGGRRRGRRRSGPTSARSPSATASRGRPSPGSYAELVTVRESQALARARRRPRPRRRRAPAAGHDRALPGHLHVPRPAGARRARARGRRRRRPAAHPARHPARCPGHRDRRQRREGAPRARRRRDRRHPVPRAARPHRTTCRPRCAP